MQGRSLLPLTRPGRSDREEEVFIQISESMVARALRTRRWKYCVYAPDRHGWNDPASDRYVEYQMYDLFSDPAEQVNLAGRGDYAAVAEKLRGRLAARIAQAGEGQVVIEPARYPA
jgi:arylsulfatase A-like enzyme